MQRFVGVVVVLSLMGGRAWAAAPPEITAEQIEAELGSAPVEAQPDPPPPVMRAEDVQDPFPDRVAPTRPRRAAILLSLGAGLGVAATFTARLTLLPHCRDERDAMTCTAPDRADIGVRWGRLFGTVAFGVGGAAFAALGARELGDVLRDPTRGDLVRRETIARGLGTTGVVLGTIGVIAGATVLGLGAHRGLRLAGTFGDVGDTIDADELARLDRTLHEVRVARAGLMVLAAAPTLLAGGIALLVPRKHARRASIAPIAGRNVFGASATIRF